MATPLHRTRQDKKEKKAIRREKRPETFLHIAHPVYSPQFLSVRSGWFVGSGSGVVTSSPAAAICPVVKAS